jgi:hypothetical protein
LRVAARIKVKEMEDFNLNSSSTAQHISPAELEGIQNQTTELYGGK